MIDENFSAEAGTESGTWPVRRREVIDWLVNDTRHERFIDNILVQMSERLVAAGIPIRRMSLHFQTNHPQWRGGRLLWQAGSEEAEIDLWKGSSSN